MISRTKTDSKSVRLKFNSQIVIAELPRDSGWNTITATIASTLNFQKTDTLDYLTLVDKFEDKISPNINSSTKFWKFYADHARIVKKIVVSC